MSDLPIKQSSRFRCTVSPASLPNWKAVEWRFEGPQLSTEDAYKFEITATFYHSSGAELRRPLFWHSGREWRLRFASPCAEGVWHWKLEGEKSSPYACAAATADARPLLRMSPTRKSLETQDGKPFVLCADTVWSLPWRALPEEAKRWARKRKAQGFNGALLMAVMPDMLKCDTRDRTLRGGWGEAFEDLPQGSLRHLVPEYFELLDELMGILIEEGIVAVWQPLFHGYGWKGAEQIGRRANGEEAACFMRYLIARYGADPAIWLVGGDSSGTWPSIEAMGKEALASDCYRQPVGIHYGPHADNAAYAGSPWLDFQWVQTGHHGEHIPERITRAIESNPGIAVANGEPTYEEIGEKGRAAGPWQGVEAWRNLCAGATMGVVYGAGSLWQWRRWKDEDDAAWTRAQERTWEEALEFPGAIHVGALGKIMMAIDLARAEPAWQPAFGRPCLFEPEKLLLVFLQFGGGMMVHDQRVPRPFTAFFADNGEEAMRGSWTELDAHLELPTGRPLAVIFRGK